MENVETQTHNLADVLKVTHTHTHTLTDPKHEVVEGLFVQVVQGDLHGQGKVRQVGEVLPALDQ